MNHTTNNSGDIDFDLKQESREAGLVTRMYRNQNSIFEVSLPTSPESNDRILRSFFLTVCSSARVYTNIKYCVCPGSEPGKIIADPKAHLPECWYRKCKRVDVLITSKIKDDYSLGVPL